MNNGRQLRLTLFTIFHHLAYLIFQTQTGSLLVPFVAHASNMRSSSVTDQMLRRRQLLHASASRREAAWMKHASALPHADLTYRTGEGMQLSLILHRANRRNQ